MITDFKALTIPEGEVVKIEDSLGRVLWEKASPLPYDAEIEYLQGDGQQYIDTGIVPTATTGIRVAVQRANNNDIYIVGLRQTNRWCIGQHGNRYYWGYGGYSSDGTAIDTNAVLDLNFYDDKYFRVKDFNDITDKNVLALPTLPFTPTVGIRLFGAAGDAATATYGKWPGRIYYSQITEGSNLIMDLIPVRVGQVGYMYDKVSKQLFGNAGTGDFGLGPDK